MGNKRKCVDCGKTFNESEMVQDGSIDMPGDWYCEKCFNANVSYEEEQGYR